MSATHVEFIGYMDVVQFALQTTRYVETMVKMRPTAAIFVGLCRKAFIWVDTFFYENNLNWPVFIRGCLMQRQT